MPARGGLGDIDPFDAQPRRPRIPPVIPITRGRDQVDQSDQTDRPDPADPADAGTGGPRKPKAWGRKQPPATKTQVSVYLDKDVAAASRDAIHALSGVDGAPANLSALYQAGITSEVERLQELHNGGKPFPRIARKLKAGRPS